MLYISKSGQGRRVQYPYMYILAIILCFYSVNRVILGLCHHSGYSLIHRLSHPESNPSNSHTTSHVSMFRFSPSRLNTTRRSINNQSGAELLNSYRRKLSRYPRQQAGLGQNLSDRYLRLEKSLRGREALSKKLDGYSHNSSSIPAVTQSNPLSKSSSSKPLQLFRGFEIPEEPKPPADDGVFFLN